MTYGQKIEALAVPTRRAVLERLIEGPASVGEIADGLPVSRPAVSQHLRVLKDANLVRETKHGTRHIYSLNAEGFQDLRAYFDQFWDGALAALQTAVKASEEQ